MLSSATIGSSFVDQITNMALNPTTSIVDYLKSTGVQQQPGESIPYFSYRTKSYNEAGLNKTLGDFRGRPEQNAALLQYYQKQSATPTTTSTAPKMSIGTSTPATPPMSMSTPQMSIGSPTKIAAPMSIGTSTPVTTTAPKQAVAPTTTYKAPTTTPTTPTQPAYTPPEPFVAGSGGNFGEAELSFLRGSDPSKRYIQGAGSPDIFDKVTGRRLTPEEAANIPGVFTNTPGVLGPGVEISQTVRPEVTQEGEYPTYSFKDIRQQGPGNGDMSGLIAKTGPSTDGSLLDLNANAAAKQLTSDLYGTLTRAGEKIPRELASMRRDAANKEGEIQGEAEAGKTKTGEGAAGFGGAFSGMTLKKIADIQANAENDRQIIRQKLGDEILNKLTQEEQQYGTEFLKSLSIPEAQTFVNLPAPVRGAVMRSYENAIQKVQDTARKDALNALNQMGYTIDPTSGQIVPTFARESKYTTEARLNEQFNVRQQAQQEAAQALAEYRAAQLALSSARTAEQIRQHKASMDLAYKRYSLAASRATSSDSNDFGSLFGDTTTSSGTSDESDDLF